MGASVVGLDIGTEFIRAVEVSSSAKAKPTVLRYHEVRLPEGAVVSGETAELNTVAESLKQLWAAGKFRSKEVILGVGNSKVLVRDLTIPKLSIKEMKESLPSYVQDLLPVPVVDALLDFYPISESATDSGPVMNGLLIAAVKDSVLSNVRAVEKAGLTAVGVDLIPFALTRVDSQAGNVAYIDIGAKTTNVIVCNDGIPHFVRIIATGGADLTEALVTKLQLTPAQAESAKLALGLGNSDTPLEYQPVVQIIREVTGELLNSLRNTLAYFANTHQNEPYTAIVVSGGGSALIGFTDALSEITRIPVSVANPFATIAAPKSLDGTNDTRGLNVALGLAIGSAA